MICCRSICGTSRGEGGDEHWSRKLDLQLDDVDEAPFEVPQVSGLICYSAAADQPLRGTPLREGLLWYLSADAADIVHFSLYINGFSFLHSGGEISVSLSPFSLVRTCKLQTGSQCGDHLGDIKIFKLSMFTQGTTYFFGVQASRDDGGDHFDAEAAAEAQRQEWVLAVSRVVRRVSQSLFRPFTITCDPLDRVVATHRRLMAGYLLHHELDGSVTLLYCELQAHSRGQAKLALYENEQCKVPVADIHLGPHSSCCERVGVDCGCFCIEDQQFVARTLVERRLWLRAVSNIKVKLRNQAPSPTREEMNHYRSAIKEYIAELSTELGEGQIAIDALLRRVTPRQGAGFAVSNAVAVLSSDGAAMDDGEQSDQMKKEPQALAAAALPVETDHAEAPCGPSRTATFGGLSKTAEVTFDGDTAGGGPARAVFTDPYLKSTDTWLAKAHNRLPSNDGPADAGAGGAASSFVADTSYIARAEQSEPSTSGVVMPVQDHAIAGVTSEPSSSEPAWGAGKVRVLLVVGVGASSSDRKDNVDTAVRIEKLCAACDIQDVTLLALPSLGDNASRTTEFHQVAQALARRCQRGDVCVFHFAGMDTCLKAAGSVDLAASLPQYVTIICVADSHVGIDLLGLVSSQLEANSSDRLRVVVFVVPTDVDPSPSGRRRSCAIAMLRAADALSLTDGPRGLTCGDFFAEMAEQVTDLAASVQTTAPRITLQAYPSYDVADAVLWPIVAAPRNLSRRAGAAAQLGDGSTAENAVCNATEVQGKGRWQHCPVAGTFCVGRVGLSDVLPIVPQLRCGGRSRSRVSSEASSTRQSRASSLPQSRGGSSSGGGVLRRKSSMPTNLGGLSRLLTGGSFGEQSQAYNRGDLPAAIVE